MAKTAAEKRKIRISLLQENVGCPQSRDMMPNDFLCSGADDIYIEASPRRIRPLGLIAPMLVLLLVHISSYMNFDLKALSGNLAYLAIIL